MIYLTSRELPKSLLGYGIWLEVHHAGEWQPACQLIPSAAREVLRWQDRAGSPRRVRVRASKL